MRGKFGQSAKRAEGAVLIVLEGTDKGEEYPISGELSMGRTQENTLVRLDRGMSRRHCVVRDEGGVFTLEDLGSANGTVVNDQKITGLEVLRHGDRIMVGETTFSFHWPEGSVDSGLSTSPGVAQVDDGRTHPGGAPGAEPSRIKQLLKRPVVIVALVVIGLLILGSLISLFTRGGEVFVWVDRSNEPVRYSDSSEFRRTAFGYGAYDDAHPDKVIVHFDYLKGRASLQYSAWGIDDVGEVVIRLNGEHVADVPATQEYRHELRVELPREHLQEQQNELEFDNVRNPPAEDQWEIGYIRIVHDPLLPPDPEGARVEYQQALRLYEDREVDPANRFRALEKLRLVRDLLEQADPRPPLYQEAAALRTQIDQELQEIFELGRFSAERAFRFGDTERARQYLTRTIRYYPDVDDARRQQLARALEALGGE